MTAPHVWLGQGLLYAAFGAVLALFSRWPVYQHLAPDTAVIRISVSHPGARLGDCAPRSATELAKLPPNMRAPLDCPRERAPVTLAVDIDGAPVLRQTAQPSGLARDGAATVYRRVEVGTGTHRIAAQVVDDPRDAEGYRRDETVTLEPAQILVIDFDSAQHRITLR